MKNYRIDFPNLIRQLLPTARRQSVRLALLRGLLNPLAEAFDAFDAWRSEVRRMLTVTNQKGVLEHFLRRKYRAPEIEIIGYREEGYPVSLQEEQASIDHSVGLNADEGNAAVVPLRGEGRDRLDGADFVVRIPEGVDPAAIQADVERYRPATTIFKIEQV